MQDLYAEISELDKKRIENYASKWGSPHHTIPMQEYLSYWNKNKQRMFKLLGNKLIYSCNFEYEKPAEEIKFEFNKLLRETGNPVTVFMENFKSFMDWMVKHLANQYNISTNAEELVIFKTMCYDTIDTETLSSNKLSFSVKNRLRNKQSELRLQKGGKLLKAIAKILKYYEEEIKYWQKYNVKGNKVNLFAEFENFRILHSRILNDKKIKGRLNISIHPLDFMTMSDNNNKWSSCMSWQESGCYRVGTVEMMNSNNVLCCYISSDNTDFKFRYKHYDGSLLSGQKVRENESEEWVWNNKKWRQLVYFTKDIIVGGKAYPYQNDIVAQKVIEVVRQLAKDNLGWTYTYGPELYKDMRWIESENAMHRARNYRRYNPRKKNIIFDTNGMYNDFICHYPNLNFWCCRNKVKKTQVICVSGPVKCLCCGGPLLEENECPDEGYEYDTIEMYHDRFLRTFSVVCGDCIDKHYTCHHCGCDDVCVKYKMAYIDDKEICLCEDCYDELAKCPGCGEWFYADPYGRYRCIVTSKEMSVDLIANEGYKQRSEDPWLKKYKGVSLRPCMCYSCTENMLKQKGWITYNDIDQSTLDTLYQKHDIYRYSIDNMRFLPNTDVNDEKWSRFFYDNVITYKGLMKKQKKFDN